MKFETIEQNKKNYPVEFMCQVFGVSTSGYYTWGKNRKNREKKEKEYLDLSRKIEDIHKASKYKYGSPRIHPELEGLGYDVSPSTVARVMSKNGIKSKLKRKFKATTDSNHKLPVAPNHLMQDFTAYGPNQIWMSDISFIWTAEGWLYLAVVLDLYSRKIVGWALSSRMTKELVMAAYLRAKMRRKPGKHLIFHSDRGSQYASHLFRNLLLKHGVIQSMSRKGNCWDSAPVESFFHTLKTDHVYWYSYQTREEAFRSIFYWIEIDYNCQRSHSSLGNMSPDKFERKSKEIL
jgi:transposase InsO family protein